MKLRIVTLLFMACSMGCQPEKKSYFFTDITAGATPWSQVPGGRSDDQFSFAVVSDLNGGERPGIFSVAMEQLRLLKPDFIMTMGDLVDGGTEDMEFLKKQFDDFDARAKKSGIPLVHVGGNHDLTNPAMRRFWEERYGKRYYHFLYKDVLFLVVDSEDFEENRMQEIYHERAKAIKILDSGNPGEYLKTPYYHMQERRTGEVSDAQSEYFERVISNFPEVRWTFVFMHKPVWLLEQGKNLARIEKALENRNYTLFNAHLHSYSHRIRNSRDYIMLGTTGGHQNQNDSMAFDHVTWISLIDKEPAIALLRMDGILNKEAKIPGDTVGYCYQASRCGTHQTGH